MLDSEWWHNFVQGIPRSSLLDPPKCKDARSSDGAQQQSAVVWIIKEFKFWWRDLPRSVLAAPRAFPPTTATCGYQLSCGRATALALPLHVSLISLFIFWVILERNSESVFLCFDESGLVS